MGEKLYATAADPKSFLLIHGGHNDGGSINDLKVREGFQKFLRTYSLL